MVLLGRPAHYLKHNGAAALVRRIGVFFHRNPGPACQEFQGFAKINLVMFLKEVKNVPKLAARPATIALPPWIDIEGRPMIVVERAKALIGRTDRAQSDIVADDVYDVVGLFNLFDQGCPIIRQKAPIPNGKQGVEEGDTRAPFPDMPVGVVPLKSLRGLEAEEADSRKTPGALGQFGSPVSRVGTMNDQVPKPDSFP
jgi:hypothetical protein